MEKKNVNRRDFLKSSLLGGAALCLNTENVLSAAPVQDAKVAGDELKWNSNSVMGLRCEKLDVVRVAVIGLGRGGGAVERLSQIEGTEVSVLCDLNTERIAASQAVLKKNGRKKALEFSGEEDWKKVCERDDIDLIYNATPWHLHVPIAVYAMRHGKHVAIEVPAALTVEDCWKLVDTAEETRRHCMMLENCCYDFFELTTLNMARKGYFGDVFYGEGAYIHDLRNEKFDGYYKHWRLEFSKAHTGNPYPTHGLGPVAQLMGINRGDRFNYLTSMSTNQFGLEALAKARWGETSAQGKDAENYLLGDMNVTMLHTVGGKAIMIQHDTTSPRPYSRIHLVQGTKGMAVKYPEEKIAISPNAHGFLSPEAQKETLDKYMHPLSQYIGEKAKRVGGHGGMDFIMDWRLIYCLRNGYPLDQDVYDAATWSSIVELSEKSVLNRSASVEVPDFTRGAWKDAQPWPVIDMNTVLY